MILTTSTLKSIKPKVERVKLETLEDAEVVVTLLSSKTILGILAKSGEGDDEAAKASWELIRAALVDEDGNPAFDEDVEFDSLPLATQAELQDIVMRVNGLGAKAEVEAEKN